jgi:hypothetical protein
MLGSKAGVRATLVASVLLAACAGPAPIRASSGANGGVIVITQAATFAYSRSSVYSCAVASIPNFAKVALRLTSDTGRVDYLVPTTGSIHLTEGNWAGTEVIEGSTGTPPGPDEPCTNQSWSLSLTPSN